MLSSIDDDGLLWQCLVRNLDWYVTQTILKKEAVANGNVSFADILELRMCRRGAFFPGRMCSAFFTFQSKESAEQLRDSWDGRVTPAVSSEGSTSLTCKVVSHAKKSGFHPQPPGMIQEQCHQEHHQQQEPPQDLQKA